MSVRAIVVVLSAVLLAASAAIAQPQSSAPTERKATRVAVLPISGAIDDVTLWSVERRLAAVREAGFDAVVFEIDTPGGEVGAMLDICLR
ncbi:MAG: hypothetical protein RJB55_2547, partial [Verrucomicrobiota bacterium]